MKFKLTQDWIRVYFLGKKTSKKIYEKGHIFDSEDGVYRIIDHTGEIIELDETRNHLTSLKRFKKNLMTLKL